MKNKKTGSIIIIILLVVCAGVIFFFSSQNGEGSTSMSSGLIEFAAKIFCPDADTEELIAKYSHIVRKTAHFTEYAVLGGLAAAALNILNIKISTPLKYLFSVLLSALFAASDEFHQMFSEGRSPSVRDVLIDTAGAAFGAAAVCLIICMIHRHRKESVKKRKN